MKMAELHCFVHICVTIHIHLLLLNKPEKKAINLVVCVYLCLFGLFEIHFL